jgi:magnesium transporter
MGATTIRTCGAGGVEVVGTDVREVSEVLEDKSTIVWVDLERPERAELELLAGELGLHLLAVEDALDEHQRDKLVHYEDHVFLVSHCVALDRPGDELEVTEVDAFIGDRWLVTVHDGAGAVVERVIRRWERSRDLAAGGVGSLLYALLDVIVDGYYVLLDQFEEFYDTVSDRLFSDRALEPGEQRKWFEMRRALTKFDRIVTPLADGVGSLVMRDLDRFPEPAAPFLRDVEVEIRRATTEIDVLRELVTQIAEVNMALRDYRQNMVMKKVTSWAAIIAVPTLITGYYGMNVPYPGSGETWGAVVATVLSLGCSGTLFVLFRRRGWV